MGELSGSESRYGSGMREGSGECFSNPHLVKKDSQLWNSLTEEKGPAGGLVSSVNMMSRRGWRLT